MMLVPLPWQWYKFPKENRELSIVPFSEGAVLALQPSKRVLPSQLDVLTKVRCTKSSLK